MDEELQNLLNQVNVITQAVAANDPMFESIATIYKKFYVALTKQGFTETAAMNILTHQGISGFQPKRE